MPKAAELTHRNLVANIMQINAWVPSLVRGQEKMLLRPAGVSCLRHDGGHAAVSGAWGRAGDRARSAQYAPDSGRHPARENHALSRRADDVHRHHQPSQGGRLRPAQRQGLSKRWRSVAGRSRPEVRGDHRRQVGRRLRHVRIVAGRRRPIPSLARCDVGSIGLPIPSTEIAVVALEPDEQRQVSVPCPRRRRRTGGARPAGDEGLLTTTRTRRPRRSTPTAGCTPAISPRWTRTATSTSWTARRT